MKTVKLKLEASTIANLLRISTTKCSTNDEKLDDMGFVKYTKMDIKLTDSKKIKAKVL